MRYTNRNNLPQSIVDAVVNDPYDVDRNDLSLISCTSLIDPPKIRILKARHYDEIICDVSERIWSLLGQSVHAVLERADAPHRLLEQRLSEVVEGKTVTGKFDTYESKHKILKDTKVTSVWTVVYKSKEVVWMNQLNVNAFLVRKAGFPVEAIKVDAILRDWSKSKAHSDNKYPQINFCSVSLPLWSMTEQEEYIRRRVKLHSTAESLPDDDIPVCEPKERWAKDTVYAVVKKGVKSSYKNCSNVSEASMFIRNHKYKDYLYIQKREGEDMRCKDYCEVAPFCNYWNEKYGNGSKGGMSNG